MAKEEQEPLFSEAPGREYQPGTGSTWKDKALEEDRAKLHEGPADDIDRKDDQARDTIGRARLESEGMSRRRIDGLLNVTAARKVLDDSSRERAAREEEERARREREREAELRELLRGGPDPTSRPDE
ncbi:MAG TPA: hypothetical protein VFJ84_00535 [Candidatus Saccharimonadales bacterium]|nr:hypothetical protein [Candidatus Saccharimonadales bacterium]